MTQRYQYEADFLKSLRYKPLSLRKPAFDPKLGFVRYLDDQVDFFKLLLDASEDSSIYEDLHYKEIKAILNDYVDLGNKHRASNQIKSLVDTPKMQHFLDIAFCMLLKNEYRNKFSVPTKVGQLFAWLIDERILMYATLYPRFHKFLQQKVLFETKYKHFLKTVTEFLTSLLINLSQRYKKYVLFGLLIPFIKSGEAQTLVALTMKRVAELRSPEFATELWVSAAFLWSDFLQPGINEREFLEENKLDFLTSYNVAPELDMEQEFKSILCAYLDHHDLERCRMQIEPLAKCKNSGDRFARCVIRNSIEFGVTFYKPIGELLSYLIAFGFVTEKQRLEALKVVPELLLVKRRKVIVGKDEIKKAITSFMVNIFTKNELFEEDDQTEVLGATASATSVPFLHSKNIRDTPSSSKRRHVFASSVETIKMNGQERQAKAEQSSLTMPHKLISTSHLQDVKPHEGNNACKPLSDLTAQFGTDEDVATKELMTQLRDILNKRSQNDHKVLQEVKKLIIEAAGESQADVQKEKTERIVEFDQDQNPGDDPHMGLPDSSRVSLYQIPNGMHQLNAPYSTSTPLMSQPRQPVQSSAGLPAQPMLQGFIPQYPQPHMVNAPVISYVRRPHYYAAHSNHAVPYNQPYMIHPNHGQYVLYPGYPVSGSVPQQVQNVAVRTTGNVPSASGMGQPASLAVSNESGPPKMQHFPQPQSRPSPAVPLQKRERKGALILDPDTLKVMTESELLDQTTIKEPRGTEHVTSISNVAPAERTTGASIQKDTPSNRGLSSEALEFRNKIASVALTASGETGVPVQAVIQGTETLKLVTASKQEDANIKVCSDSTSTSSKNEASSPLQNTDSDNKKVITNNVSPPGESPKDNRFIYQSDFLKSLKNNPACLKKPEHLPKLDIIHDKPLRNRPDAPRHKNRHQKSGEGGGEVEDMFLPQSMNISLPKNQLLQKARKNHQTQEVILDRHSKN